jgi:hypothetical protein
VPGLLATVRLDMPASGSVRPVNSP